MGSLVPIMSLAHMQRHGHQPIALVGGGTGLVGRSERQGGDAADPDLEEIEQNAEAQKKAVRPVSSIFREDRPFS